LPASLAALRLISEAPLLEIVLLTGSPQERAFAINAFQFFVLSHLIPFCVLCRIRRVIHLLYTLELDKIGPLHVVKQRLQTMSNNRLLFCRDYRSQIVLLVGALLISLLL
jgi:hypothetical protein